jgi:hypothetical protein
MDGGGQESGGRAGGRVCGRARVPAGERERDGPPTDRPAAAAVAQSECSDVGGGVVCLKFGVVEREATMWSSVTVWVRVEGFGSFKKPDFGR